MIRSITGFLLLICCATSLYAEDLPAKDRQAINKTSKSAPSIYKLTAKTGVVYKIQTAVGYVTTIELPSEALKVFMGDQDLFVVEVYGHEVIIKPATEYLDARSNLTIYIQGSRLSFDVSVGSPETADFVLDFRYPTDETMVDNAFKRKLDMKRAQLQAIYQEKIKKEDKRVRVLAQKRFEEALKNGAKIRKFRISKREGSVQLNLLSLSQIGDRYYLRFNIMNSSPNDYFFERIVLGKEVFKRSGFGVSKDSFIPVEFSQNLESVIAKRSDQYGLISFDKVTLGQNEKFILRLYEKDKVDPIEIASVPSEV